MESTEIKNFKTDVLVIGGGAAGMRASIEASMNKVSVALITKGQAARSGATTMACPSYQTVISTDGNKDNPDIAFEDACFQGRYLGDENLLYILTHESEERALDLEKYGVNFRKDEFGNYLQVKHPGQSYERNLIIRGNGYAMARSLKREIQNHKNIRIFDDIILIKILKDNNNIAGAFCLDMRKGEYIVFETPAIILATGGYPELWKWTDTEPGLTGDGVIQAFHVGADLIDLEMMLFYPTGLCFPNEIAGTLVQYEGLLTKKYCGGVMLNGSMEEILPNSSELPVRDIMMKIMFSEIENKRQSPHGGLFIDLSKSKRSKQEIKQLLRELDSLPYNQLTDLGINVFEQPIEVKPVTHFTLGGIRINEWGETSIHGLFAAGEVAGNIHGANRTSGNALAETQVFGARAGKRASIFSKESGKKEINFIEVQQEIHKNEMLFKKQKNGIRPIEIKRKVKNIMNDYVNHKRNAESLNTAINKLRSIKNNDIVRIHSSVKTRIFNYEWEEAIEAINMVQLAELVALSALKREESRGHHWRTDFPTSRSEWEKHVIIRKSDLNIVDITDSPVIRLKNRFDTQNNK